MPDARTAARKWVWVAGSAGQAAATAVMALTAATGGGTTAGVVILAALAAFALARSLSSIASKDVLGRTVPKGTRGRVTGLATVAAGAIAITGGVGIRALGGEGPGTFALAALLAGATLVWVGGAAVFARVTEPAGESEAAAEPMGDGRGWLRRALTLLGDDRPSRRYVVVRTLLLVSALSPPFLVTLASQEAGASFGALGPFVVASGFASLVGGRL